LGTAGCLVVAVARRRDRRRGEQSAPRTVARAKVMLEPGEKCVGIDLGTTNSAVACFDGGQPTVIPNAEGGRTTPSVVAWTSRGECLVGERAKRQAVVNPDNTFYSVKRFIGRGPSEVKAELSEVNYKVDTSSTLVSIICPHERKKFAPEDISAQILRKLARDAGAFLGATIKKAVITVPAYFNDSQRQATKDAGTISGLEVLRIVNEPTAASLAYGLDKKLNETIMVFDLGGGTFDVSVLVVGDGVCEVLATSGDTRLGGDDFDKRISDWLADEFEQCQGVNLRTDSTAMQRLTEAAEQAKVELSSLQEVTISLPFIAVGADGPMHIEERLSRAKFEQLSEALLEKLRGPVKQALKDASVAAKDLNEVVLVGGSTRIPAVKALAKEYSGGKEPNQSVNPDEVVAIGAAVQAGVLTGEVTNLVLLDVIPLSLSVATHDGQSSVFLPRNTRVPAKKSKTYTTFKDGQGNVEVQVVQGERKMARHNKELGLFLLTGIPRAPRGIPQVEVTFDVDSNGILQVTAMDKVTKREQVVTITGSSTLAPEDVERKVEEAKIAFEEEDRYRALLLVKNDAETAIFTLENMIRQGREFLELKDVELIESKAMTMREYLAQPDINVEMLTEITLDLQATYSTIIGRRVGKQYDVQDGVWAEAKDLKAPPVIRPQRPTAPAPKAKPAPPSKAGRKTAEL